MKINNIDVDKLEETVQAIKADLSKAKKVSPITGEWNLSEGAQFYADIQYENGKMLLEADQPSFLGGGGTRPGPLQYCLYGMASCYAATFVSLAAMENIKLKSLKVLAENSVDFSRVFGVTNNPVVDEVRITLTVSSEASRTDLSKLERLAYERCPAVYCLTNPIKLVTSLQFE